MNRKGFIGLMLLTVALIVIVIASTVLFDFFFAVYRSGHSAENMAADYAALSSGIYYGAWCVKNSKTPGSFTAGGVTVTVTVSASGSDFSVRASRTSPSKAITALCSSGGIIKSWE